MTKVDPLDPSGFFILNQEWRSSESCNLDYSRVHPLPLIKYKRDVSSETDLPCLTRYTNHQKN